MNAAALVARAHRLSVSLPELLMAAVAATLITFEVWLFDPGGATAARTAAGLVAAVALAFLRQAPFAAYLVNGLAVFALVGLEYPSDFYQWTNLIALFAVASRAPLPKALISLAVGYVGIIFYFVRFPDEGPAAVTGVVLAIYTTGWFAGRAQLARGREDSARRENRIAVAELTAQRAEGDLVAQRSQLAQELHDVVGHAVNVMVVHAGAGQGLPATDPKAREIFTTIAATGRTALADLDRMLDVLQGNAQRSPLPGLLELEELCSTVRSTGLDVELSIADEAKAVSPSVALTTYRIVQEALTNVIKHAHATAVHIAVCVTTTVGEEGVDDLSITVRDNGSGGPAVPGRGLGGIAARAAMHGGSVQYGPSREGGFQLTVGLAAWTGT